MKHLFFWIQVLLFIEFMGINTAISQYNPDFFPEFTANAENPIIRYGDGFANATWNDPSVIKVDGQYIMYTTAAVGIILSDSNEVKVYRQISSDGINWTLSPETPILEPVNDTYYDGGTETPSVLIKDGIYHMYLTCYPPGNEATTYVIAHATSPDGLTWEMDESPILESTLTDVFYSEIVGEPGAVVYHDSIYVYFTAAGIVDGLAIQGIGCIKSADGATFGAPELAIGLPSDVYSPLDDYWGLSTPSAIAFNDSIYVFTDVAQIVNDQWTQVALHHFKTDGISGVWHHGAEPIHHMQDFTWTDGDYLSNLLAPCPLLDDDGSLRIWYAGHNIADFVGADTIYNVTFDSLGMFQVIPEFYGIGTSSFQFTYANVADNSLIDPTIAIFPNPSSGNIQVTLNETLFGSTITIVNFLGQKITEPNVVTSTVHSIDLTENEKGIYFLQLENGAEIKLFKIVLI